MAVEFGAGPGGALLLTAALTIGYQVMFYLIGRLLNTSKLVDVAGTSNFFLLALVTFARGVQTGRKALLTVYVTLWSARLCVFLLLRVLHWGHDRRFTKLESSRVMVGIFWTLQALWIWTVSLPVSVANASAAGTALGMRDLVAGILLCGSLLLEGVADISKLAYKPTDDMHPWIDTGVWRYSRHPNYFADISTWTLIAFTAAPDVGGWWWTCIASPVFIAGLLMFVSGVPILERSADRKYGQRADYVAYKKSTSVLVPMPPGVYARLPGAVKKTLFMDFDMYNHLAEKEPLVRKDASE